MIFLHDRLYLLSELALLSFLGKLWVLNLLYFYSQNQRHSNQLRRAELEARNLQERLQVLTNQNKMLHAELQEMKRKQAEIECKVMIIYMTATE